MSIWTVWWLFHKLHFAIPKYTTYQIHHKCFTLHFTRYLVHIYTIITHGTLRAFALHFRKRPICIRWEPCSLYHLPSRNSNQLEATRWCPSLSSSLLPDLKLKNILSTPAIKSQIHRIYSWSPWLRADHWCTPHFSLKEGPKTNLHSEFFRCFLSMPMEHNTFLFPISLKI